MGMVRRGRPSPVERWCFFSWELGGCGTHGLLGLRSCLSAPDLVGCLVGPRCSLMGSSACLR